MNMKKFLVGLLLAAMCFGSSAWAFDDPSATDDLLFIHHSSGGNWLDDSYNGQSNLRNVLSDKDYIDEVNEVGYGTVMQPDSGRPASLGGTPGDNTNMNHWILWHNDYLERLKTYGSATGRNRIIMFKSCYPISDVTGDGSEPGDPFSSDQTLANYKAVYRHPSGTGHTYTRNGNTYQALEDVFAANPDTLFIVVTAPPRLSTETTGANAARARQFNDWLKKEWLASYNQRNPGHKNVAVYDWFDILAAGQFDATIPNMLRGTAWSRGDSHPSEYANWVTTQDFAVKPGNYIDYAWQRFTGTVPNTNAETVIMRHFSSFNGNRQPVQTATVSRTITGANGNTETLTFKLLRYTSPGVTSPPAARVPLIVTVHQWGGNSESTQAKASYIPAVYEDYVLMNFQYDPTTGNEDDWWFGTDYNGENKMWAHKAIMDMVREAIHTQLIPEQLPGTTIDENMVYVFGCSVGGTGTWQLGTRNPDVFAAAHAHTGFAHFTENTGAFMNAFANNIVGTEQEGIIIRDVNGQSYPARSYSDLAWWLSNYRNPSWETTFMNITGGTGDDTTSIAAGGDLMRPVFDAQRRGFMFNRHTGGHASDSYVRLEWMWGFRKNQSFLAFTNRSGFGVAPDQNGYVNDLRAGQGMGWNPSTIVDLPNRYEVTLTGSGTADITPRRLQNFIEDSSSTYRYWIDSISGNGETAMVTDGVLTIPQVQGGHKLIVTRTPSSGPPDTAPPTVPTDLAGTASSSSVIDLTWTASTDDAGVAGYRIYRDGTQIGTSATTSYSDTGLSASTAYSYRVSAYDAAGNVSEQCAAVNVTTQAATADTAPPSVPADLAGTASSSSVIGLTWTASTDNVGVAGYRIYRDGAEIGTSATTSYSDTGLSANTTYGYRVGAYDAAGNVSEQCTAVNVTTPQAAADPNAIRAQFVSPINAAMKAHLRGIRLRGQALGRTAGIIGQWGDSITNSQAYLGGIGSWGLVTTPPSNGHDYEPILLWMGATPNSNDNPLNRNKGANYCAESGWRVSNGLAAIDDAVIRANPSWSLTMYGTNDIRNSWDPVTYERGLRRFIQINIDEGIVPVLSTIPPCVGFDTQVVAANTVITQVAQSMNIPLVDLYGLFTALHPTDWNTALLVDGVHPSHTYASGDLSDESMSNDGYNIRSVLTLDMAEKIKRIVFDNGAPDGEVLPVVTVSSATHAYKTVTNGLAATFNISADSGPAPTGYSYVLDRIADTVPDTTSDGASETVNLTVPEKGDWYFHVRAVSGDTWGPAVHYPFTAWDRIVEVVRHQNETTSLVADTFISSLWGGNDNFGRSVELNIYNDSSTPGSRGLFRFELAGLATTDVRSARLVVYTSNPVTSDVAYQFFPITGNWIEGTGTGNDDHSGIIWNDGLTFGTTALASGTLATGSDRIEVDITPTVIEWLDGSLPNNGVMLQHGRRYSSLWITSSEYGCKKMRPTLIIDYNRTAPPVDTTSPTVPTGLSGTASSSSAINLSWTASTDNVSVAGYRIYRDGTEIGTSATNSYADTGRIANTAYSYSVSAYDAAGNESAECVAVSVTTPAGRTVRVTNVTELRNAINNIMTNDTILLADGDYQNGSPLVLSGNNVTLRGESLDATRVILRGRTAFSSGGTYDELDDILRIRNCNTVRIEHITFTEAHGYGIKLELDATANPNDVHIDNCRFINIGTRHIKGTRDQDSNTKRIRGGSVRNCYFENTVVPPGTGNWYADGNYVAGIDAMSLADWVFEDNEFRNIHGRTGEGRAAIFIWHYSENITIQRNRVVNCDRGITLGLSDLADGYHVDGAICRNNFIAVGAVPGYSADAGIESWSVNNVRIYNNTVWRIDNYTGRGIRFINNINNTEMVNNLVRGQLVFDHNLSISRNENNLSGNISADYFADPNGGDLHLTANAVSAIDAGVVLSEVTHDFDGQNRPFGSGYDIGADEFVVPHVDLSINFSGSGQGTVSSSSPSISCNTNYSTQVDSGTSVTLHASRAEFSLFAGWSGDCIGTGDCSLFMNAGKNVTAAFDFDTVHKTRIGDTESYYPTLQEAYDGAPAGDIIKAWETSYGENLVAGQNKSATISGGHNQAYTSSNGYTTLQGSLTVKSGSLTVERLIIR